MRMDSKDNHKIKWRQFLKWFFYQEEQGKGAEGRRRFGRSGNTFCANRHDLVMRKYFMIQEQRGIIAGVMSWTGEKRWNPKDEERD